MARADAFDEAARLYEKGQAAEAVNAYEDLLKTRGASFALLYNLGNAQYRAGSVGKALWAWRAAEYLNPWDSDLQANIGTALVHANLPQPKGLVDGTLRRLPLRYAAWTALLITAVAAALMSCTFWSPALYNRTAALRWLVAIAAAALWVAYAGILWAHISGPNCVVIAKEVSVRYGPLDESPAFFAVPHGTSLHISGVRNDWFSVRDDSGRKGWISQALVKRLVP